MNEIVAAITYRDQVYIFTRNGDVYRMWTGYDNEPYFEKMMNTFPN